MDLSLTVNLQRVHQRCLHNDLEETRKRDYHCRLNVVLTSTVTNKKFESRTQ